MSFNFSQFLRRIMRCIVGLAILVPSYALGDTTINDFQIANQVDEYSGAVTLQSFGVLDLNDFDQHLGSLSGSDATTVALGTATLTVGLDNTDSAFAGTIRDLSVSGHSPGNLTKIGTGIFTLSGMNEYTGLTTISGGTLRMGTLDALTQSGVLLGNGATLDLAGYDTNLPFLSGADVNGSNVALGGAILGVGSDGTNSTYKGVISGSGDFYKLGAGTLTLGGNSSYSGTASIVGGTLRMGIANALSDQTSVVLYTGGTLDLDNYDQSFGSLNSTLQSGTTVYLGSANLTVGSGLLDAAIMDGGAGGTGGSVVKTGPGTLTLSSLNSNYTGGTAINGGVVSVSDDKNLGDSAGHLSIDGGTLQTTADITSGREIDLNSGGGTIDTDGQNSTLNGYITNGSGPGSLTKSGAGILTLTNTLNDYTGGTIIDNGTLAISDDHNLGDQSSAVSSVTFNGGALQTTNGITSIRNLLLIGNGTIDTQGNESTFSGHVTGAGNLSLVDNAGHGGGTAHLAGAANDNSGGLTIDGVIVQADATNVLGSGDVNMISEGYQAAVLNLNNNDQTVGALNGDSNSEIHLTGATLHTGDANNGQFDGYITGTGGLEKIGSGVLTLTNTLNDYAGGTAIEGGVLSVADDHAMGDPTGPLSLNGGTLGITQDGFVSARTVNLTTNNGTISADDGVTATLSGDVLDAGGTGALTKSGAGTLVLSSLNSNYSGGTTINGGTLNVSDDRNLGNAAGAVTLDGGALGITQDGFASARTVNLTTNNGTISADDGVTATLSGTIQDAVAGQAGALTKAGAGTLVLSGANSYTGGTTVNAGTLQAGAADALGTGGVTLSNGGSLNLANYSQRIGWLQDDGSSTQVMLGAATLTLDSDDTDAHQFYGVISGDGGLTKEGTGIQELYGNNQYTGETAINGGTLSVSDNFNLGDTVANSTVSFNGGTLLTRWSDTTNEPFTSGRNLVLNSGGGVLDPNGNTSTFSGDISGEGGLTVGGLDDNGGTVVLAGSKNTYSGGTLINAAAVVAQRSGVLGTGHVTMNDYYYDAESDSYYGYENYAELYLYDPNVEASSSIDQRVSSLSGDDGSYIYLGSATLRVGYDGSDSFFAGGIYDSNFCNGECPVGGSLVKEGAGTLTMSGGYNSDYTGATRVEGGTLMAGAENAFSPDSAVILANASGVTLDLNDYNQSIASLSGGGAAGGEVKLGIATLTTGDANDTRFDGVISGEGGSLVKQGSGKFMLTGANTYTGGTEIRDGTVSVSADHNLGDSSGGIILSGGTLGITGTGFTSDRQIIVNSAGGTIQAGTGSTLQLNGGLVDGDGAGSLTKSGAGILVLAGANTYSGGTTISAGTLQLGADNAVGTGDLTVGASGAFDMAGFNQSIGNLSNNGATHLRTGTLNVAGNYSGAGTLATSLQSGTAYGRMNVTGDADLHGGTLSVSLIGPFIPTSDQRFSIITATGGVIGQFETLVGPAALAFDPIYSSSGVAISFTEVPFTQTVANTDDAVLADILQQLRGSATGDLATVIGNLNILSHDDLVHAFDQINPKTLSSLSNIAITNSGIGGAGLGPRFSAIHAGGERASAGSSFALYDSRSGKSIPVLAQLAYNGSDLSTLGINKLTSKSETGSPWGFFAAGNGSFGRQDSFQSTLGNQVGYSFNSVGMSMGADYRLTEDTVLGGLAGYSGTDANLDAAAGSSHVDSARFGLYSTQFLDDGLYVNGYLGGALNLYQTHRNMVFGGINRTANGTPSGQQLDTQVELGYDYKTKAVTVTPIASVAYTRAHINSFTEEGANSMDMDIGGMTAESLRTSLGTRLSRQFQTGARIFTPNVSAAWEHEYKDQGRSIDAQFASGAGNAFTVQTSEAGRDAAVMGVGCSLQWTSALSLTVDYSGELGRTHFYSHTFNGGIRYRF